MALLEALSEAGGDASAKELAEMVGLNPATAYNLLQTFKSRGYVMQSPATKGYSLGLRVLQLAESVNPGLALGNVAAPILRETAGRLGETVYVSVPVHGALYRVAMAESPQRLSTKAVLGESREGLEITSSGKVFLAYMPEEALTAYMIEHGIPGTFKSVLREVRDRGYALNLGEHDPDICGIGPPVRKPGASTTGEPPLIMTASVPRTRFDAGAVPAIVGELVDAGLRILGRIGLS